MTDFDIEDANAPARAIARRIVASAEWEAAKPTLRIGRPPSRKPLKVSITIRFYADVLAALKATGPGWQTRVNDAMRGYVETLR